METAAMPYATAGSAVVFAGITVIIALSGLTITGIPFLDAMGLSAALTVLIAVIISLFCIPDLLGCFKKLLTPKKSNRARSGSKNKRLELESNRWGRFVTNHPLPVLIAAILLLGAISAPAVHMHTGLPDNGSKSVDEVLMYLSSSWLKPMHPQATRLQPSLKQQKA